ncbi:MAG: ABC transporter ATP-binding protein [Bacteroidia bacterium]|jgi:lipopolysaccharide transport system ATP-binding protein|nr:ABC transporter ATP-binding protein [Bacteroidia bacterium]
MKPALEVNHISKSFRLTHNAQPYLSLRDSLAGMFTRRSRASKEMFHALDDVSFAVERGEAVGIIGKNGAGKSTLLKILSKITPPNSGSVRVRGRIASLLEVGTGFHPELSGRENVYLNGAILGMSRAEINRNFDDIIDFSGTGKFADTPLKHFSSGMQLRLAFAVAAFLEPEIIVIDEVLAVGDAEFQQKCLGKMDDISRSGRTILFVSHNMAAVQSLCSKTILLSGGKVKSTGKTADVIAGYLNENLGSASSYEPNRAIQKPTGFTRIDLVKPPGTNGEPAVVRFTIHSDKACTTALDIRLQSYQGAPAAFGSLGTLQRDTLLQLHSGTQTAEVSIDMSRMANGLYALSADLTVPHKEYYDRADMAFYIENCLNPAQSGDEILLQEWNYGYYHLPVNLNTFK